MIVTRHFAFVLALVPACAEPVPELPQPRKVATTSTVSPDDLAEGRLVAFGLRLPAGASVKRKTPSSLSFEIPADYWATVKYVEGRLTLDSREKSARKASFTGIAAKDGPRIHVVVRASNLTTEITVRVDPLPESVERTVDAAPEREAPFTENEASPATQLANRKSATGIQR
jgi:hypothetical protein